MAGTDSSQKIIFQNPCIILNEVQLPENVGMVMRAMLNFGFKNLRLVNPKVNLNDKKIISSSAGAYNIIGNNIKIFNSLEESIEDIKCLCATSVRKRDLDSFVGNPRNTIETLGNSRGARVKAKSNPGISAFLIEKTTKQFKKLL